jgi:hypothetical protein
VYLVTSKEHPPAIAKKRNDRDLGVLMNIVRDFSRSQSEVFILVLTAMTRYRAPELTPLVDDDVEEAAAALASTFETASRGVIYEHRAASPNADRISVALKSVLHEAGKGRGTPFERDAATVLRQVQNGVRAARAAEPDNPRAFLDLVERTMRKADPLAAERPEPASRLIVP